MQKQGLAILFLATLFASCYKDADDHNCYELKAALAANDVAKTGAAMNKYIGNLPSQVYGKANINVLCQHISSGCGLMAKTGCFDCIKTLPSQSEIHISYEAGGSLQTKVVDLSYTAANTIVFLNLHD